MSFKKSVTAALVLAATFACSGGDHSLVAPGTPQRPPRIGHSKQLTPFQGGRGLSAALAAPANGIAVQDMTEGVSAQALAQALVGPGVTVSNVTYTGAPGAAGLFASDTTVLGMSNGIVLSTGAAKGVIGPNVLGDLTTEWGLPGDAQLTALAGDSSYDASVLEFDVVPDSSTLYIAAYVFGSDEYNEFVGSEFDDAMAFYVNGTNCALIGGQPVSINAINNGYPYGVGTPSNPDLYRNNDLQDGGGNINTELDGLTRVLTCAASVQKGVTNHIKLAIADVSDDTFDSDVFIGGGALTTIPPKPLPIPHAVATFSMAPDCSKNGALVTLDGSGSYVSNGGGIADWKWYYGTGPTGQLYGQGKVVTRHFDPLSWPMALQVTDSAGNTAITTFNFTVSPTPTPVNAMTVGPLTLAPPQHQYVKMAVSATSTGTCPAQLTATATSSQADQGTDPADLPGDIKVVHADGTTSLSSAGSPALTFDPAHDTLYLRAEALDSVTDRTYSVVLDANGTPADTATVTVPHPLPTPVSSGAWAIFANSTFRMTGNARTDSYDPASGPYSAGSALAHGSVASIQSIVINGNNPRIRGDATSGGTIPGGAYVSGTRTQHASLQPMPVVACPAGPYTSASAISGSQYRYRASSGDLSVSGNGSVVLSGTGPFYFSSVSMSGNATFSVSGTQHVDIYVSDDLDVSGNGVGNGAHDPAGISFISCGNPQRPSTWTISGNGNSYFALYAPNHDVQISGNGELFGCLVGDDITMTGNAKVHLDQALGSPCASGTQGGGGVGNSAPGSGGNSGGGANCPNGKWVDGKCCDDHGSAKGGDDHGDHGSAKGGDDHDKGGSAKGGDDHDDHGSAKGGDDHDKDGKGQQGGGDHDKGGKGQGGGGGPHGNKVPQTGNSGRGGSGGSGHP